jgi:C1A family cysteine protease
MKNKLLLSTLCLLTTWSAYAQKFVRLTQANAQQTIQVAQDQVVEIKLPSQPSTGYGWYIKNKNKISNVVEQVGTWNFVPDNTNSAPGGTGSQIIRFTALSQGSTDLELVYERPWQGVASAADHFTITINAAGKYNGVPVAAYNTPTVTPSNRSMTPSTAVTPVPTSFSWLTQGSCTPVKDQGQCGSCWSFAANGSFEAVIKYWDNNTRNLSEQWLINCDANCSGCNGGWCPDDMFQTYGCVYAADLGYAAQNGTCASSYTYHEKVTSHQQVNGANPTDAQIKQAIYNYGPVWAGIDAGNNFQNYTSGVFSSSDGTSIDHAIVLVGWDDAQGSWSATWGESGYMRIAYGTSGVGSNAEYLVYKGLISHAIAPSVAFVSNTTNTCSGAVQFTDQSNNAPTSWLWNFGDGQTSTLQNPTHTYANGGAYSVTLTATNTYGNNVLTKSNLINVSLLSAPTTTGATRTGPGVVNLSAAASGTPTLNWYTAQTGGTLVNTGATYSPNLSTTTTYYVADEPMSSSSNMGMSYVAANGSYYTANTDRRLYFTVLSDMVLKSVTIYANTAGSRQIEVLDNAGNSFALSTAFNATVGQNVVPLNFTFPAGKYSIKLSATSAMDLFRNSAAVTYPYSVSGLASIDSSDASGSVMNYYYYFYNWVVAAPSCSSTRTNVVGVVNVATGIQNVTAGTSFKVYPNPTTGVFTIDGLEGDNSVEMYDVVGKLVYQSLSTNTSLSVDLSDKEKGVYFYRVLNTTSKTIRTGKVVLY